MIEIILLIVGIVYAVRYPRLRKLTPQDFPGVDATEFFEWQQAERMAIDWSWLTSADHATIAPSKTAVGIVGVCGFRENPSLTNDLQAGVVHQ
jgi:hypothetical protein